MGESCNNTGYLDSIVYNMRILNEFMRDKDLGYFPNAALQKQRPIDDEVVEAYGDMSITDFNNILFSMLGSNTYNLNNEISRESTRVRNRKRFMKALKNIQKSDNESRFSNSYAIPLNNECMYNQDNTTVNIKSEIGVDYTHPFLHRFI